MRFRHMWCWKLHGRVENGTLVLRVLNWVLKTEQTNKNMLCIFVRQADKAGSDDVLTSEEFNSNLETTHSAINHIVTWQRSESHLFLILFVSCITFHLQKNNNPSFSAENAFILKSRAEVISNVSQTKLKAQMRRFSHHVCLLWWLHCTQHWAAPTISPSEITPKIMILSLTTPVSQFKYKWI